MAFDVRLIILIGGAVLLGFLLYPRGEEPGAPEEFNWITTFRELKDEELHYPKAYKSQILRSFDLGFVYRIDKLLLELESPETRGPKQFDLLGSIRREGQYDRIYTYKSNSPEFPFGVLRFEPTEARWVQLVINEWFGDRKPKPKSVRIGATYRRHGPIISVSSSYDLYDLPKLIDGLFQEGSKWIAARRRVEIEEKEGLKVSFEPPKGDVEVTFDLGIISRIYGTRLTTDGPGNNLARYSLSVSLDGRSYKRIYTSPQLEDKTVQDIFRPSDPISARFVRLSISKGDWFGDHAEIREFEVFTDGYRLVEVQPELMDEYNAVQAYYENCGLENRFSPHLVQGFPFDRGTESDPKIRYFWAEGEEVDPGNSENQRSFCYHYDSIVFSFSNLDPSALYWVQVSYLQDKNGTRRQRMLADGFILHDEMEVPKGKAGTFTYQIPKEAYSDGEVRIEIQRLQGPNAVVSELSLFEARPGGARRAIAGTLGRATKLYREKPLAIDGNPEEWPRIYPLIPQGFSSPTTSPISLYLQWDEENLYLLAVVDRSYLLDEHGGVINPKRVSRLPDTLDFFVDTALNRSPGMYTGSDHHFRFSGLSPRAKAGEVYVSQIHHHMDAIPNTIFDRKEIQFSFKPRKNGYVIEARIPKGEVLNGYDPIYGRAIGVNFILHNDYSQPAYWSAKTPDSPPNTWGEVRLVGSVSGELLAMRPETGEGINSFNAGQRLLVALRDPDRSADPETVETVVVELSGDRNGDVERLTLRESQILRDESETVGIEEAKDSDLFSAALSTEFGTSATPNDGKLTVYGGETITITYIDPYRSETERDVEVKASLRVNVGHTGKVMFVDGSQTPITSFLLGDELRVKVEDEDLKGEEIAVRLTVKETDEAETVKLKRGEGGYLGGIPTEFAKTPKPDDGVLQMMGLQTVIAHYTDEIQDDGRTNVDVRGVAKVGIGETAIVRIYRLSEDDVPFESKGFNAGDRLMIVVQDRDLNRDPAASDAAEVTLVGGDLGDEVKLKLKETGADTGEFSGIVQTIYGTTANKEDSLLQVRGKEMVKAVYLDSLQSSGARNVEVISSCLVNTGSDGVISFVRSNYVRKIERFNAGDTLYIRLQDDDVESETVEVTVEGDKTGDSVSTLLTRSGTARSLFLGSVQTEFGAEPKEDSLLQVVGGEKVTVRYIDRLRSSGETNVPVTVSCLVNTGSTGRLRVYRKGSPSVSITSFKAGETLVAEVEDFDLSLTGAAAQIFEISAHNSTTGDAVRALMREVSGNAGVFRGEVKTSFASEGNPNDELLQVQGGDVVTFTYIDVLQDDGRPNVPIKVSLQVEAGVRGRIELLKADGSKGIRSFSGGSKVMVRITDADLNLNPETIESVGVTATGNLVGDEVLLTLFETEPNTGIFEGILLTSPAEAPDFTDSTLQVREKELVTVTYVDPIAETGETNVNINAYAIVSSSSPGKLLIVDQSRNEIGGFNAGTTLYFLLEDLLLTTLTPRREVNITVSSNITNDLATVTLYRLPDEEGGFWGSLPTRYGTTPVYDDTLDVQGGELVVATYDLNLTGVFSEPITDSAYVNKGHLGRIIIVRSDGVEVRYFDPGLTLYFTLEDPDLNADPFYREETDIWVSTSGGETKLVTLRETGENTGIFGGRIETRYGRRGEADVLGVVSGETVTATYRDPLTDTGETNVDVTDTCKARMVGWAAFAREPIIVDGVPDNWPLETVMKTPQEEAMMWAQWNADYLYLFVQVYDEEVEVRDVSRWYEGSDAVEVHIDLSPSDETKPYYLRPRKSPSRYILWFCPKGAGFEGNRSYAGQAAPNVIYKYNPPITVAVRFREKYYIMEISIPFKIVFPGFDPIKTRRIRKIGFNFKVYRSDLPPVWWVEPEEGEAPSDLGTLYLER
jgi:hypothetical protein